ncbi:unnamed protein product [Haemonchus placei]|uniref:MD-2-related lipid-recognition domain-containing protein n=1 Tax=Haemonchus placei TaxID=6290 RepID=A0A3P7UE12_HAEPC|nr:unnamed protein product [Haemonchus placei]
MQELSNWKSVINSARVFCLSVLQYRPRLIFRNNIDGCDYAHNCPLTSGPLTLDLPLDLSQFSAIINILASYRPYEFEIRMFNYNKGNTKHEEFACVMAQVELI